MSSIDLKANPNCPNLLKFQRRLLPNQLAFIPRSLHGFVLEERIHIRIPYFPNRDQILYRQRRILARKRPLLTQIYRSRPAVIGRLQ
jgi:hypothetical protein